MNVKKYLDTCYNIIVDGTIQNMVSLTFIRLCTSHITKNLKKDVHKYFKKKTEFLTVCAIIGIMFDIKSFIELDGYLKDFLTLLMVEKKTSQVENIRHKIRQTSTFILDTTTIDHEIKRQEEEENFTEFDTIFKNSKFFQTYDRFLRDANYENDKNVTESNPLFNPKFAAIFLKKYVAFLPFWSSILSNLRCNYGKHANNGLIEGNILIYVII